MISTKEGLKRIDRITTNDYVLTSDGYKKVLKVFNNGLKQVNKYSLQFDTFVLNLWSTQNHLIKTKESWSLISKLLSGQTVYLHKHLTTKSTDFIQKKDIFRGEIKECTLLFGNFLMAKLKKAIMYTMLMRTHGITVLKILKSLNLINTLANMPVKDLLKTKIGLMSFIKKELKKQKNGINQKREEIGTVNNQLICGKTNLIKNLIVSYVEKNIKQDTQENQNTAITTAKLKHLDKGESKIEQVYDLMIEDIHEYFANGLLVHNSIDPTRYVVLNKLSYQGYLEIYMGK